MPADGQRRTTSRYESLDYRRWSPVQRAIKGTISAALRTVASIDVEDGHHLDTPGPYILVLNHMALVDVPLVLTVMPRPVIVLAASEYQSNRITDWFLADKGNAIYVDRGAGDIDALDQALTVLRAGGIVGLSPEGRRSHTGALERAHNGVAYLAAKAGRAGRPHGRVGPGGHPPDPAQGPPLARSESGSAPPIPPPPPTPSPPTCSLSPPASW